MDKYVLMSYRDIKDICNISDSLFLYCTYRFVFKIRPKFHLALHYKHINKDAD